MSIAHNQIKTVYPVNKMCKTFNDLSARKIWVRQNQKRKTFWILMKQEVMGWLWHQLDHVQIICTSLQTTTPAPHQSLNFDRPVTLTTNQQCQGTEGNFACTAKTFLTY